MGVPLAIALKDLKLLFRDKANAFFTFVFPVIVAIFFGLLFGGSGGTQPLGLLVLDESKTPQSQAFVKDLQDDPILKAESIESREAAESQVRRGNVLACVVIPKDFAQGADAMFAGGGMKVEAIVDPSRTAEANLLVGKLNELAFRQLSRSFSEPDQMKRMLDQSRSSLREAKDLNVADRVVLEGLFSSLEKLSERTASPDNALKDGGPMQGGWTPVKVELSEIAKDPNRPRSSFALTFPQGIAWVLMSGIAAFAASIARERTRGTLLRLSVAPVSRGRLLFGKALGCFLACMLGMVLLLFIASFFKGVTLGNPVLLAIAVIASSASAAGVMMVISGIFRTEGAAEGAGRAVVLILAMIGGGTIPLFVMPPFMRIVSSCSPFKWSILAVEGAMWRGFTLAEMAVPIGVLFGLTAAGAIAGFISVRRAEA